MSTGKWLRLVRIALALTLVALATRSLAANWAEISLGEIDWNISPLRIGGSVIAVFVAYAFLIEGWRRLAEHLDAPVPVVVGLRIWFLASLGKYLPGKVWAVAGAGVMAAEAGLSGSAAAGAAVVMQVVSILTGIALALVLAPASFAAIGIDARLVVGIAVIVGIAGMTALSNARLMAYASRLLPDAVGGMSAVPIRHLVFPVLANVAAWFSYGVAFMLLAGGLVGGGLELSFVSGTAAFAASYLAGFVFLLAPGGVGVREGALVILLTPSLGPALAVGLALASRIQLTITELAGALVVMPLKPDTNLDR